MLLKAFSIGSFWLPCLCAMAADISGFQKVSCFQCFFLNSCRQARHSCCANKCMTAGPPVCEEGDVLIIKLICLVIVADGFVKLLGFVGSIALLLLAQSLFLALQLGLPLTLLLTVWLRLSGLSRRSRLSRCSRLASCCWPGGILGLSGLKVLMSSK